MIHQAHNIPWNFLARNFVYRYECQQSEYQTNLLPTKTNNLVNDLQYFSKRFHRTLQEHCTVERAKHLKVHRPMENEEEVFSVEIADRIKRILEQSKQTGAHTCSPRAIEKRKMKDWLALVDSEPRLRPWRQTPYDVLEPFKILIFLNEMRSVLRIAAHPLIAIRDTHHRGYWDEKDFGMKSFFYLPLMSYLCLNILLTKPELYDNDTKKDHVQFPIQGMTIVPDESFLDYRLTYAYQLTLLYCTDAMTQTLPHQAFFGLSHSAMERPYDLIRFTKKCGTMSFANLKSALGSSSYPVHGHDIDEVIWILQQMGLPTELCLTVIDFAEYKPSRRIVVVDDPLHHHNALELRKYLTYCWQLLVRSELLSTSIGMEINWELTVETCIKRLFAGSMQGIFGSRILDDTRWVLQWNEAHGYV